MGSLAINATLGKATGVTRGALIALDGALNLGQGAVSAVHSRDAFARGDYLGGSLSFVGAGLGFASAGLRGYQFRKEGYYFAMAKAPGLQSRLDAGIGQARIRQNAPRVGRLSEPGGVRSVAKEVHNLAGNHPKAISQTTVSIVEAELADGTRQFFASGSGGYLRPAQVDRLVELGVPRENIFSGARYSKGFTKAENHAERVILRNLPESARTRRWGISWASKQKPIPCDVCKPFVTRAGGILEDD